MYKEKKAKDPKYELLKRTGKLYKRDIFTCTATVMLISIFATISDGMSIHFSIDGILMDSKYFTMLLTCTVSAVLDISPVYYEYAIEKIELSENKFKKVINTSLFALAVGTWFFVFISLCVLRYAAVDFILKDALSVSSDAYDTFTPQITDFLKNATITLMNVSNFATSAAVVLANHISFTPKEERDKQKAATSSYYIERFKAELESERKQLEDVIDDDTTNTYEEKRANNAVEVAEKQAQIKKQEAVEELEKFHGDGDVTEKITSLYRK